ncbi:MAG: hypothetical protein ACYCTB_11095 [bacterium]
MSKILTAVVIILGFSVMVKSNAFAFSLPKLKITYTKHIVKPAHIIGKTNGLPVITVNFVNKPLWLILQNVSNKTGYVFSTNRVNLAQKINLKGRYNFAVLLAKLFNAKNDKTTVNIKTKKVKVWQ